MEEISYYVSFIITFLLCFAAVLYAAKKHTKKIWSEQKSKNIYSVIALTSGICGGSVVFHGLVWFFHLLGMESTFWHGEILIAVMLYNLVLSLILLAVGRIIIGWK